MQLLNTQRAYLRPFRQTDYADLFQLVSNPEVMKHTGFRVPLTETKTQELLQKWIIEGSQKLGVWAAIQKEDDQFIGWFMLKITNTEFPEIGFMLDQSKWNKGFGTELSRALLNYGLKNLGFKKIIATVDRDNRASLCVLEKIGMTGAKDKNTLEMTIQYEIII